MFSSLVLHSELFCILTNGVAHLSHNEQYYINIAVLHSTKQNSARIASHEGISQPSGRYEVAFVDNDVRKVRHSTYKVMETSSL